MCHVIQARGETLSEMFASQPGTMNHCTPSRGWEVVGYPPPASSCPNFRPIQTVRRKTRHLVAGTEHWIEETSYFREALLESRRQSILGRKFRELSLPGFRRRIERGRNGVRFPGQAERSLMAAGPVRFFAAASGPEGPLHEVG